MQRGHFLQALQNVEAAASAVALQRVGGIGDQLQFAQHELRGHDNAVEEPGLGNVGDAAVDNDAGVEDLVTLLALLLAAKDATQSRQVEQVALVGAHDQAHIGHQQHHQDLQEALGVAGRHAAANHQRKQIGAADAEDAPDGRADQPLQAHRSKLPFEQDDACPDQRADTGILRLGQPEGANAITGN